MNALLRLNPYAGVSRRAYYVFLRHRDVFFKTIATSLIPPFLDPLFYLLGMGYGLGSLISPIKGMSYVEFIAPALVASVMMTAPFFECTVGSFVRIEFQKTFDAMVSTPVSIEDVVTGDIMYGAGRALLQGTSIFIVIAAFGLVKSPWAILIIPLCFLLSMVFGSIAMVYTSFMPAINYVDYFLTIVMTPMFLFAGTFFPINQLPAWAQKVAYFMPLYHTVNIARALNVGNIGAIWGDLLWMAVCGALFYALALWRMRKRLIK
jgi:lipooligosaccharide transport system permease protein